MKQTNRRLFLKATALFSLAQFNWVKRASGTSLPWAGTPFRRPGDAGSFFNTANDGADAGSVNTAHTIDAADDLSYIVDLHCHPTMKNYLLGDHMWRHHVSSRGENSLNMQVDIHHLKQGNVRGILAAHHLPEKGLRDQAYTLRKLMRFLRQFAPVLVSKMENGNASNFQQLTTMMDDFEAHVQKTDVQAGGNTIAIAKSYAAFKEIKDKGQIAVAQAIEGSHALGRHMQPAEYLANLNFLADRGICLITLSHFFANDLSYPVEGMGPTDKKHFNLHWLYDPTYDDRGLTPIGKQVVRQMLLRGVIVDMTHTTPNGRKDIFDINDQVFKDTGYRRPVIFTHTGAQQVFDDHTRDDSMAAYKNYKYIGVTKDEIGRIRECGGVIGIVFMNFWLIGNDTHTHDPHISKEKFKWGISNVLETIAYIRAIAGDYKNIAIGSDFDGFADSPKDLKNPKFFPGLVAAMKEAKISDGDIALITHGNAERVLEQGWGKPLTV